MKSLFDLCPTDEMRRLFRALARRFPAAWSIDWSDAKMEEVNGKRVLCLSLTLMGDEEPTFTHYCEENMTEEEMLTLTDAHGRKCFTALDEETGVWVDR